MRHACLSRYLADPQSPLSLTDADLQQRGYALLNCINRALERGAELLMPAACSAMR